MQKSKKDPLGSFFYYFFVGEGFIPSRRGLVLQTGVLALGKYAGGIFVAENEVRQHRLLRNAERFYQKYHRDPPLQDIIHFRIAL